MAQILVRQLDPEVVERLKVHARENGRSLEAEVRAVLRDIADRRTRTESAKAAAALRAELASRPATDSVALIREDRDFGHRDVSWQW
jgi:plasmid stability protein